MLSLNEDAPPVTTTSSSSFASLPSSHSTHHHHHHHHGSDEPTASAAATALLELSATPETTTEFQTLYFLARAKRCFLWATVFAVPMLIATPPLVKKAIKLCNDNMLVVKKVAHTMNAERGKQNETSLRIMRVIFRASEEAGQPNASKTFGELVVHGYLHDVLGVNPEAPALGMVRKFVLTPLLSALALYAGIALFDGLVSKHVLEPLLSDDAKAAIRALASAQLPPKGNQDYSVSLNQVIEVEAHSSHWFLKDFSHLFKPFFVMQVPITKFADERTMPVMRDMLFRRPQDKPRNAAIMDALVMHGISATNMFSMFWLQIQVAHVWAKLDQAREAATNCNKNKISNNKKTTTAKGGSDDDDEEDDVSNMINNHNDNSALIATGGVYDSWWKQQKDLVTRQVFRMSAFIGSTILLCRATKMQPHTAGLVGIFVSFALSSGPAGSF